MTETPSLLVMIVGFLLVLGPLVTVHELGHYLVGRWFGVKADAFSIGFGKELAGWTDKAGTRWKLSAIPLGGYVQFAGDMNPASQPNEEWLSLPEQERARTFQAKPLWQRTLIVAAGPFTNFIVAVAILGSFTYVYGKMVVPPVIAAIAEDSAAAEAGLRKGDRIVAADGTPISTFDELRDRVVPFPGYQIVLTVKRGERTFDADFTIPSVTERDRFGNESRIGRLGIVSIPGDLVPVSLPEAAWLGVVQSGSIMKMMGHGIVQIVTGRRTVDELGGPIKIAKYSGEQLSLGWQPFVYFAALISINLAFINLLPIPGLDGGHLAFYASEAIRRKPIGRRSHEWAYRTGIAFVLALMVFVTINDILTLPIFGS